jgi:copper chaperone CopZ
MKLFKWILSHKIICIVPLVVLVMAAVYVAASDRNKSAGLKPSDMQPQQGPVTSDAANQKFSDFSAYTVKAILNVEGMSCSGCIATIKSSLSDFAGIQDITRSEFETEVAYAKNRYLKAYGKDVFSNDRGQSVLDNIKAQVISRLINEGIQMQEVQRVGYRLDAQILGHEFNEFIAQKGIGLDQFKTALSANGYPYEYFKKKFENRVLLRRYIEENVIQMSASDYDKQQQYLAWFNNAKVLSTVVIYDKRLERLSQEQSSGGCGSSCKS